VNSKTLQLLVVFIKRIYAIFYEFRKIREFLRILNTEVTNYLQSVVFIVRSAVTIVFRIVDK